MLATTYESRLRIARIKINGNEDLREFTAEYNSEKPAKYMAALWHLWLKLTRSFACYFAIPPSRFLLFTSRCLAMHLPVCDTPLGRYSETA